MTSSGQVILAGVQSFDSSSGEGSIIKYDMNTGVSLGQAYREYSGDPSWISTNCTVSLFPANITGFVALNHQKMSIQYYITSKDRPVHRFFAQDKLTAIGISPDGDSLLAGNREGRILAWNIRTGQMLFMLEEAHYQAISAIKFTIDGKYFTSAGMDGLVKVWSWNGILSKITTMPIYNFSEHRKAVTGIQIGFGIDGNARLISCSLDGSIIMYDLIGGERLARFEFPSPIKACAMNSSETLVFAAGEDGLIYIIDLGSDNQELMVEGSIVYGRENKLCLKGHNAPITSLAFSLDESLIVSGDNTGVLIIWDVVNAQMIRRITTTQGGITYLAIIPKELLDKASTSASQMIVGQPQRNATDFTRLSRVKKVNQKMALSSIVSKPDSRLDKLRTSYSKLLDYAFSRFK